MAGYSLKSSEIICRSRQQDKIAATYSAVDLARRVVRLAKIRNHGEETRGRSLSMYL